LAFEVRSPSIFNGFHSELGSKVVNAEFLKEAMPWPTAINYLLHKNSAFVDVGEQMPCPSRQVALLCFTIRSFLRFINLMDNTFWMAIKQRATVFCWRIDTAVERAVMCRWFRGQI
jgi:hypothetical protein